MKFRFCHLLSFCIALTLFQACTVDDITGLTYDSVEEYGNFFGDPNQNTVILNAQGGPMTYLNDEGLVDLIFPSNTNGIIVGNIVQRQMGFFPSFYSKDISEIDAKEIIDNSVDDLALVIRHFKSQDKQVYVMGQSYGGFLIQELISKYGSDLADQYLILGSRLIIEQEFTDIWIGGNDAFFDFNSTPSGVQTAQVGSLVDQNLNRLSGFIGQNNYIDKMENLDLSNLHYFHTPADEKVGPLTAAELSFLDEKGAKILQGEGDHKTALKIEIAQAMSSAFEIPLR